MVMDVCRPVFELATLGRDAITSLPWAWIVIRLLTALAGTRCVPLIRIYIPACALAFGSVTVAGPAELFTKMVCWVVLSGMVPPAAMEFRTEKTLENAGPVGPVGPVPPVFP